MIFSLIKISLGGLLFSHNCCGFLQLQPQTHKISKYISYKTNLYFSLPENELEIKTKTESNLEIFPVFKENNISSRNSLSTIIKPLYLIGQIPRVGIPLNIFTLFFTHLYYGENIVSFKISFLQFLIGFYTYGNDKLKDAQEFNEKNNTSVLSPRKKELYELLLENNDFYSEILQGTFYLISLILYGIDKNIFISVNSVLFYELIKFVVKTQISTMNNLINLNSVICLLSVFYGIFLYQNDILAFLPFILLLDSSNLYVELKRNIGFLKPVFVSIMWVASILILPCVIHDGGTYDILNHSNMIVPPFLTIFAFSNLADIGDIKEDKKNNILTLPVLFGSSFSFLLSSIALTGAIYSYNPHIFNIIQEITNSPGTSFIKFISSALPYFDSIGHTLLHANNEFITYIINSDLPKEYKEKIILGSIKMAQGCDNTGTILLQVYFDIVNNCFHYIDHIHIISI